MLQRMRFCITVNRTERSETQLLNCFGKIAAKWVDHLPKFTGLESHGGASEGLNEE